MKTAYAGQRMNRYVKRLLVTIGVTVGFTALTAGQASAGMPINHSEPTLNRK
jgi:hypothetical protein